MTHRCSTLLVAGIGIVLPLGWTRAVSAQRFYKGQWVSGHDLDVYYHAAAGGSTWPHSRIGVRLGSTLSQSPCYSSVDIRSSGGTPSTIAPLLWSCGLVAGLAPYALADYLLGLARRRLGYRDAAT